MKVKVFEAATAPGLEKQINEFLAKDGIEVLTLDYRLTTATHGVIITYKDRLSPASRHEMDK